MEKDPDQAKDDVIFKKILRWIKDKENNDPSFPVSNLILLKLGAKSSEDEDLMKKYKTEIEFLSPLFSEGSIFFNDKTFHILDSLGRLKTKELVKYKKYLQGLHISNELKISILSNISIAQVFKLLQKIEAHEFNSAINL
jgi:hypothetical protein